MMQEMMEDLFESYKCHQYDQLREKSISIDQTALTMKVQEYRAAFSQHKGKINTIITDIVNETSTHIDVVSGRKSILSPVHYVSLLTCGEKAVRELFPQIGTDAVNDILKLIKMWMIDCIEENSCERLINIINADVVDKVALRRECESPRYEIEKRNHWLCFEAEMKIKIWKSQYETFVHLMEGKNSISQLNMGEGKTQVIIPMIMLEQLYSKQQIPRINILSSLYQEAYANYFNFFAVTSFNLPCVEIPFNREVNLTEQNIRKIKYNISLFLPSAYILVDRESVLSIVLKLREYKKRAMDRHLPLSPFLLNHKERMVGNFDVFDIFDEVDALMTPKKSFVYAIGDTSSLPSSHIRLEISRMMLELICKHMLNELRVAGLITIESEEEINQAEK